MPSPPSKRFFAVVLNWKRAQDTTNAVVSLRAAGLEQARILVVDNESTAAQEILLREAGPETVILPQRENLGYAGGNNAGLRYALENGAEAILILNNDAEVAPEAFVAWEKALESGERVGMVGAAVFDSDSKKLHNLGLDEGGRFITDESLLEQEVAPVHAPHGSAMVLRADMLREIGLLDARLFLMGEETDLAERARLANWEILVAPGARVFHEGGASFGGVSPLKVYYSHRNTLLKWTATLERTGRNTTEELRDLRARYEKSSQQLVIHWLRQSQFSHALAVARARRDALLARWGRRDSTGGMAFVEGVFAMGFVLSAVVVELGRKRQRGGQ